MIKFKLSEWDGYRLDTPDLGPAPRLFLPPLTECDAETAAEGLECTNVQR